MRERERKTTGPDDSIGYSQEWKNGEGTEPLHGSDGWFTFEANQSYWIQPIFMYKKYIELEWMFYCLFLEIRVGNDGGCGAGSHMTNFW